VFWVELVITLKREWICSSIVLGDDRMFIPMVIVNVDRSDISDKCASKIRNVAIHVPELLSCLPYIHPSYLCQTEWNKATLIKSHISDMVIMTALNDSARLLYSIPATFWNLPFQYPIYVNPMTRP